MSAELERAASSAIRTTVTPVGTVELVITELSQDGTVLWRSSQVHPLTSVAYTDDPTLIARANDPAVQARALAHGIYKAADNKERWRVARCRAMQLKDGNFRVDLDLTLAPAEIAETRVERDGVRSLTSVTKRYAKQKSARAELD